jgi:hypothetical protein
MWRVRIWEQQDADGSAMASYERTPFATERDARDYVEDTLRLPSGVRRPNPATGGPSRSRSFSTPRNVGCSTR